MVSGFSLPTLQFQSICLGLMCHLIPARTFQFCIYRNLLECPRACLGTSYICSIALRFFLRVGEDFCDVSLLTSWYSMYMCGAWSSCLACPCMFHKFLDIYIYTLLWPKCTWACLGAFLCVMVCVMPEASCYFSAWKHLPEFAYEHSRVAMAW
jgi:hypothetical protein